MANMKCSHILLIYLTCFPLVLMIVVFSTPGIFILEIPKTKEVQIIVQPLTIKPQNGDFQPIPESHQPGNTIELYIPKKLTLYCGLWYFRSCVNETNFFYPYGVIHEDSYCNVLSYPAAKGALVDLPSQMQGLNMDEIYNNIGDIAKFAMIEMEVEMAVSVVCLIISLVTTVCYIVGKTSKRGVGLAAYITALLAGILNAVATSKCVMLILQARVLLHSNFNYDMSEVKFAFPYGLLLSGLAAISSLGSSLVLLLILTDRKRAFQAMYSETLGDNSRSVRPNVTIQHNATSKNQLISNESYNPM